MRRSSSSISSSERRRRAVFATLSWTFLCVVALDVALGTIFRYPDDNQREPTLLQRYFDYGRSVEGKLHRILGSSERDAAPIAYAGWLERTCTASIEPVAGRVGLTVYGMSFSDHVGHELEALDPSMAVSFRSGPSASLNHSYTCFRMLHDARHDPNQVQVMGVLASSVDRMTTLTGMTTSFEAPMPYTYPRYRLADDGALLSEQPLITSPDQMRQPLVWAAFERQLARDDAFYDPLLMRQNVADDSTLMRLLRRAYAQHAGATRRSEWTLSGTRSDASHDVGPLMSALLIDFARRTRDEGKIPLVILFQDRPGIDDLYRSLGPALREAGVPFVSTHTIVPTTNPGNFLPDSHFTPAGDRLVAAHVLACIRALRAGGSGSADASRGGQC